MTMHLEGPYLTTTRYAKRPHRKWASSEAKRKAESEATAWTELEQRLAESAPRFSGRPVADPDMPRGAFRPLVLGPAYPPGREPLDIPSRPDTPGTVGHTPGRQGLHRYRYQGHWYLAQEQCRAGVH